MSMNAFHARQGKPRVPARASAPLRDAGMARADFLLVQQGLAASRTEAQVFIKAGRVRWAGGAVTKPAREFPAGTPLVLADTEEDRFVSGARGQSTG